MAKALYTTFQVNNQSIIFGTQHGEKLYETLCTTEEMIKAYYMGDFYSIPAYNRDLKFKQYFFEEKDMITGKDYTTYNPRQLSVNEVIDILLPLPFIQEALS